MPAPTPSHALPSSPSPLGRVAVVTGASQGLGFALADALTARGWTVVADARHGDRLDAARRALEGRPFVPVAGDITDDAHRRAVADVAATLGPVHLVVNNASTLGASPLPSLDELDADTFLRILDTNVVAPLQLLRTLDAHIADGATVVNITSDAGVEAYAGWGGYGASKAALEHASRVLAEERPDLRVLVVDPGDMRTAMHQDAFPGEDISDRDPPEASIPGLLALIEGDAPSGTRHQARRVQTGADAA